MGGESGISIKNISKEYGEKKDSTSKELQDAFFLFKAVGTGDVKEVDRLMKMDGSEMVNTKDKVKLIGMAELIYYDNVTP